MIIADTSVWVQHLRYRLPEFARALDLEIIAMHPAVLGELAVGNLARRRETLENLRSMPQAKTGASEECLDFIEMHRLYGRGIGWNDVQLLVSARLSNTPLWSFDLRLSGLAFELGVAYPSS